VTDDQLYDLARRALPHYGIVPDAQLSLLNVSENATFGVTGEQPLVLRLHRPGYRSPMEITSELWWVDALRREAGITTPEVVAAADGRRIVTVHSGVAGDAPRHVVVFRMLPGREPQPAELLSGFGLIGELTARMHRHTETWRPPAGFERQRWDLGAMLGDRPLWGRWQDGMGVDSEVARVLTAAEELVVRRIREFGAGRDRFGLIHADLRLANLLVDGDRTAVIDFDDCGPGWFLYDLAAALSFLELEPEAPALVDAWLTGYRRVRPLSVEEEWEIPTFVMLRRLVLVAWVGSHASTDLARELGPAFTRASAELAEQYLTSHRGPVPRALSQERS
jgi:Ser/Thr protein kinase RdoA (MazF antagonist)